MSPPVTLCAANPCPTIKVRYCRRRPCADEPQQFTPVYHACPPVIKGSIACRGSISCTLPSRFATTPQESPRFPELHEPGRLRAPAACKQCRAQAQVQHQNRRRVAVFAFLAPARSRSPAIHRQDGHPYRTSTARPIACRRRCGSARIHRCHRHPRPPRSTATCHRALTAGSAHARRRFKRTCGGAPSAEFAHWALRAFNCWLSLCQWLFGLRACGECETNRHCCIQSAVGEARVR